MTAGSLRRAHRPAAFTTAAVVLWVALLVVPQGGSAAVATVGVTAGAAAALATARSRTTIAVVALIAAVGMGGLALRFAATAADPAQALVGDSVQALVTITADARPARTGRSWVIPGRLDAVSAVAVKNAPSRLPVLVIADEAWADVSVGAQVAAEGRLTAAEGPGPVAALLLARKEPVTARPPPAYLRVAEDLRLGLRDATDHLGGPARGLIPSLVVGDTRRLSPVLVADLRDSGLAHLTAVSGANVSIVLLGLMLMSRLLRVRPGLATSIGGAGVIGFLLLARPEPSVLRASVMGLLGLVAVTRAGRGGGPNLLGAAVCLLLLADPWLSRSLGFALSVAATAALMVPAGWLASPKRSAAPARSLPPRLRQVVIVAFAAAAAAQAAVVPLLLLIEPEVSLVAVPANMLAAPAVAPATLLGVTTTVLAPVSAPLAAVSADLAGVAGNWIGWVAKTAAGLESSVVTLPGGGVVAAGATVVVLVAFALTRRSEHALRWWSAAVVLALLVAAMGRGEWLPSRWALVLCDVGQGDAVVVSTGPRSAIVVDTGPDPVAMDRCLDDLGVVEVPLLVLTHFHDDHIGGLGGVLGSRRVGAAVVSPLAEPEESAGDAMSQLADVGVATRVAAPGDGFAVGDWRGQVLWPRRIIREGSAANQASVVLRLDSSSLSVLLTGDVEAEAQRALLGSGSLLDVDVLKVPHHGSADFDPAFLQAVSPQVALIGVGQENPYGHPAPELLQALAATGATTARTDRDGAVAVALGRHGVRVVSQPAGMLGP